MAKVRIRPLTTRGRPIPITGDPITVGRHPDNTIRVDSEKASRHHCVFEVSGSKLFVRDLKSRNGTKVNDTRIDAPRALRPGDIVRVGGQDLAIELVGPAPRDDGTKPNGTTRPKGKAALEQAQQELEAANALWMSELETVVNNAPKTEQPGDDLALIDAGGDPTKALQGDSVAARATRAVLRAALAARATDIHIEPKNDATSIRIRVDGQMVWLSDIPDEVGTAINNIVKTACLIPHQRADAIMDGHFSSRHTDVAQRPRLINYRASFTPTTFGGKLVLRILDARSAPTSLEDLGMPPYMLERVQRILTLDAGLLLVCGPTGSGKTTTLYGAIREIDRDRRNVITIEDPVEYQLDNTTQIPVNQEQGNDFGMLLRSVLRQDPDVILVGEIRDGETARTAMQAAMTGHLVFSTVHAKDTMSSVFRLLDLGIEPYLVASSLQLVLAQRLIRLLCQHCKTEIPVPPGTATRMGRYLEGKHQIGAHVGCVRCLNTGYLGRHAIFELLDVNDDLRDVILNKPTMQRMRQVINQGMFTTLEQSGWRSVSQGLTSMDEIERVAASKA